MPRGIFTAAANDLTGTTKATAAVGLTTIRQQPLYNFRVFFEDFFYIPVVIYIPIVKKKRPLPYDATLSKLYAKKNNK